MGLSSVLVDTGRVLTFTAQMSSDLVPVPVKVEGETQMTWVAGEWFACRVNSPAASEAEGAGRERVAQKPSLLYELEDEQGGVVELHAADRVEVVSEELGTHTYEIEGEPSLLRKKTDLIVGEASLSRIVDQPRAQAAA